MNNSLEKIIIGYLNDLDKDYIKNLDTIEFLKVVNELYILLINDITFNEEVDKCLNYITSIYFKEVV